VILYEMLTAKLPFTGSSPLAAMKARLSDPPIPPNVALPSISPHLQEVLYRALEKDPRNRYARAHDFAHDLHNLDRVGIEDRPELRNWKNRSAHLPRTLLLCILLLLVPVAILMVMLLMPHGK
jgi:eukaryotic-like serine/threonine-protein kinase